MVNKFIIFRYIIILLLYYYINLRSSVVFCLFSGDIYLSLSISLLITIFFASFITVSKLLYGGVLETFVILWIILLPIKSPAASFFFFFWISLFKAVLSATVVDFGTWSRRFWLYLQLFTYIFIFIFTNIFSKRQKFITF